MTLSLRAVTAEEFSAFLDATAAEYVDDMVAHGGFTRPDATTKASQDLRRILPQAQATPGHSFYYVTDEAGRAVGRLWLAEQPERLFVYAIWIAPDARGHGWGRHTMLLAEAEARRRGLSRIELNVFGGNDRARRLYQSLGYRETAVVMRKDLP